MAISPRLATSSLDILRGAVGMEVNGSWQHGIEYSVIPAQAGTQSHNR
jgi:hypothetical protein